jgi:hypothetical protein
MDLVWIIDDEIEGGNYGISNIRAVNDSGVLFNIRGKADCPKKERDPDRSPGKRKQAKYAT